MSSSDKIKLHFCRSYALFLLKSLLSIHSVGVQSKAYKMHGVYVSFMRECEWFLLSYNIPLFEFMSENNKIQYYYSGQLH